MRIYLAGPLFTTPEREFNDRLATMLRVLGHIELPLATVHEAANAIHAELEGLTHG